MSQARLLLAVTTVMIWVLATPLAVQSAPAPSPNICNIGELWEGQCLSKQEWEAGWYLHPDNDSGDGIAVEVAYDNYPLVIQSMPHSICIDWRTANCDGTTPPPQPVHTERTRDRRGDARKPASLDACIKQANTKPTISSSCLRFHNYNLALAMGEARFDADLAADALEFSNELHSLSECISAENDVVKNLVAYTEGRLSEAGVRQIEASIVIVQSWACTTRL